MELKDKKNILNMTFDNMNMSEERSGQVMKELLNYNIKREDKEENKSMDERKDLPDKNLHEISPKNDRSSRWQYVFGSVLAAAVLALGIFIWNRGAADNRGNRYAAGSNVLGEETTAKEAEKGSMADEDGTGDDGAVFYIETGDDKRLQAVVIPSPSSKDIIYEVDYGDITMLLAKDYNYDIYSRRTEDGLEMLAVGVRKEGDTYTYVYSKQLKTSDDDADTETVKTQEIQTKIVYSGDTIAETQKMPEDATAQTVKLPEDSTQTTQAVIDKVPDFPDFIGVSFTKGEKYTDRRDKVIEELSAFYDTVNEFIDGKEPEVSYKQEGIEGELFKGEFGEFEYELLENVESTYVTCGMKDPIKFRLEGYFSYIDEEISQ